MHYGFKLTFHTLAQSRSAGSPAAWAKGKGTLSCHRETSESRRSLSLLSTLMRTRLDAQLIQLQCLKSVARES